MRSLTAILSIAVALLLAASIPRAAADQPKPKDYALIFGTVWGPDDRPMPGVPVNVRRSDQKKPKWHLNSTRLGEFSVLVPAGDYVIWAETKGLKSRSGKRLQPSPQVAVHVNRNERVDTGLHLK
jgi:hypothetical protein